MLAEMKAHQSKIAQMNLVIPGMQILLVLPVPRRYEAVPSAEAAGTFLGTS